MKIRIPEFSSDLSNARTGSRALVSWNIAILAASSILCLPGISQSAGARWRPDGFDVGFIYSTKELAAKAMAEHTCETQVNPGGFASCEVLSITFHTEAPLYATYSYATRSLFPGYWENGTWHSDAYTTSTLTRAAMAAPIVDRFHYDNVGQCPKYGNPIFPLSGLKKQAVGLYLTGTGLDLTLNYDTRSFIGALPDSFLLPGFFGKAWFSSLHKEMLATAYSAGVAEVRFIRGDGNSTNFALSAGQLVANPGAIDTMVKLAAGWRYYDQISNVVETYGQSGKILLSASIAGRTLT